MANPATPPTTPPAIGPAGFEPDEELPDSSDSGSDVAVAVAVVDVTPPVLSATPGFCHQYWSHKPDMVNLTGSNSWQPIRTRPPLLIGIGIIPPILTPNPSAYIIPFHSRLAAEISLVYVFEKSPGFVGAMWRFIDPLCADTGTFTACSCSIRGIGASGTALVKPVYSFTAVFFFLGARAMSADCISVWGAPVRHSGDGKIKQDKTNRYINRIEEMKRCRSLRKTEAK